MSTLGASNWTMLDRTRELGPDNKYATIAEIATQENAMLQDAYYDVANGDTYHTATCRNGVPTANFGRFNKGYTKTKATAVQVEERLAMTRNVSEVDRDLAELGGNKNKALMNQAVPIIEGIAQTWASTLVYGDTDTAEDKFYGFSPRYNSLSAENSRNVINGLGTGSDQTSIYLVVWGPGKAWMAYPEGSKAGIRVEGGDKVETIYDADNNPMPGYRTYFSQQAGLVLEDWRYVVRICNIDTTELKGDKSGSSADITELLSRSLHRVHNLNGRAAFYANRTVNEHLALQINNTTNVNISREQTVRGPVNMVEGIPFRTMDAILDTEAAVS